jgi:hypothetical protein
MTNGLENLAESSEKEKINALFGLLSKQEEMRRKNGEEAPGSIKKQRRL